MTSVRPINLYFDSGAFAAWKRNTPIKVERYIEFLIRYPEAAGAVSLDVIPGSPGKSRTQASTEEAAAEGWKNYKAMIRAGLDPMPVVHIGERRYWLEKYLDAGATFIGLGGVAGERDSVRRPWLDEVFAFLCCGTGWPAVRVHGFGITSPDMIHRYPWFSSDSFSWAFYAAYGFAVMPRFKPDGSPDYYASPYSMGFSRGSRQGKVHSSHLKGVHYDVLGDSIREHVDRYIAQEGFTVDQLHNRWTYRARLTLRFYKHMVAAHRITPFYNRAPGLCEIKGNRGGKEPGWVYRMLFTENTSYDQSHLLHTEGIDDRLMSYGYFVDNAKLGINLERYIRTGLIRGEPRKILRARLLEK